MSTTVVHRLRQEANELEIIDRLDRLEALVRKLVDDPKVTALEPWLSKKETALALGVSAKWIQERVSDGLPHRTIAGAHKFRLSIVTPWLEEHGHLREVE